MLRIERHIVIEESAASVVDKLAVATNLSRRRIKQTMQKGAIWINRGKQTRRLRRATRGVQSGDVLHIYYDEQLLAMEPLPARLIADEGDYSVWYKPYGMRSQGSRWGDHTTINRWAEQHLLPQRPAFVVHRLDRAATGLMLIAHSKRMANELASLFRERQIEKRYRVIVHGKFHDTPRPLTVNAEIDTREACSHFNLLKYDSASDRSLLDVAIETGRKHQIRRHLSGIGFPVVGDRLYGIDGGCDDEDLQLTACMLAFRCPVTHVEKKYSLTEELMPVLN